MAFTGLAGRNEVTVSITGNRYLVRDVSAFSIGAGCADATSQAGKFSAFCQVPLNAGGTPRPFRVTLGAGDDVVTNTTGVRMNADGSAGDDLLVGGSTGDSLSDTAGDDTLRGNGGGDALRTTLSQDDGTEDVLEGGPGDDDIASGQNDDTLLGGPGQDFLRGGLGADVMDPGADPGDTVTYLDGDHQGPRVVASLDGKPNDGTNPGGTSEGDNVAAHTPRLIGGHGVDVLSGNDGSNHLIGNLGDDVLVGWKGNDHLEGGPGDDTLAENALIGVGGDGVADILDGQDDTDTCRTPPSEDDVLISCETVDIP